MYFIARGSVNGYEVSVLIHVSKSECSEDRLYNEASSFAAEVFCDMGGTADAVYEVAPAAVSTLQRILGIKCYHDFIE